LIPQGSKGDIGNEKAQTAGLRLERKGSKKNGQGV
jgi:hypothetical protein